jgi:hypothetical protein
MHTAIWNAQYQVMKKIHLIDKDCVNIPDIYGILPMTYAAILGNQELVLLLIYLNANVKSGIKIPKPSKSIKTVKIIIVNAFLFFICIKLLIYRKTSRF